MKKLFYIIAVCSLVLLPSCYDEYKTDYNFSATYFAKQFPIRSLILQAEEPLTFEVGVVVAGIRTENLGGNEISFRVAPELLTDSTLGASALTLLPEEYYTFSNATEFDMASGDGTRLVTQITLNKDTFLNDPLAIEPVYALPLEITSHNTDSILEGKNFTIVVVRFYNEYHGEYAVRGVDYTLNTQGEYTNTVRYGNADEVVKADWVNEFTTTSKTGLRVDYVGANNSTSTFDYLMNVDVREDGLCELSGESTSELPQLIGSGEYDFQEKTFYFEYFYFDDLGAQHLVMDTAYYFTTPMSVEAWQ